MVLRRCTFRGNFAFNSGGAIYSSIATSNLLFDSCLWEYNECTLFGGAVYLGDSHYGVVMRNSVMQYNNAISNSGRYLVPKLFVSAVDSRCIGGAYYVDRFNGDIVVDHSDIINNSALLSAGESGFYIYNFVKVSPHV